MKPGPELADLRVALVHDWLTGMRGGEKVLEAMAELFPDAPIFTLIHLPGSVSTALESHPIYTSFLQSWPLVARRYRGFLPLFPSAIEDFDLRDFDLVLSTSHCVAKGALPRPDAFHLCYCHTPMRYAWDQEHTYFPRRRGPVARLRNLALTALRTWDVASVPRVDHFAANSHFVARRIARYYGHEASVLPPPVDVDFFTPTPEERERSASGPDYAIMVSALNPYKRVDLAIAACEALGLELRIVGTGPDKKALRRLAGDRVRFLGRIEGAELRDLYRGARLFLQPGLEDFGIASVEALASGTPVVALGTGGVIDIVEDETHGVLYNARPGADEGASLRAAIDKALQIRFNYLKLVHRAQSFSHRRFASRLLDCLSQRLGYPETPLDDPKAST